MKIMPNRTYNTHIYPYPTPAGSYGVTDLEPRLILTDMLATGTSSLECLLTDSCKHSTKRLILAAIVVNILSLGDCTDVRRRYVTMQ